MSDLDPARAAGAAVARRRVRHRPAADRPPRRRDLGRSAGASAGLVRERDRQLHGARQRRLVRWRRRQHDALRGQHQLDERRPDARHSLASRRSSRPRPPRLRPVVFWPGPPSGAWLDHIGGDLALRAEKGSLVDVAARRRRPRRGTLEHQRAAAAARARFPRRVQPRPRVRRDHGRLRHRRRQRLHGQPEADGPRGRGRAHRPHGAARPRLPPAGRRHGGARQGTADGRRAARGPAGCRRAADFHAHLQEAAGRHRPRVVLRHGQLGRADRRAADQRAARRRRRMRGAAAERRAPKPAEVAAR